MRLTNKNLEETIMSHWKKFESNVLQNTKKDLLATALAEMGLGVNFNSKSIRNGYGHETVDAVIIKDGKELSLGFNFPMVADIEQLEVSGDFWATGVNEKTFMDSMSQIYQKHNLVDRLTSNGWAIEEIKTNEQNEIEIEAYRYA